MIRIILKTFLLSIFCLGFIFIPKNNIYLINNYNQNNNVEIEKNIKEEPTLIKETKEFIEKDIFLDLTNVKTIYSKNENLNLDSLKVYVLYEDNSKEEIKGYLVKGVDLSTYGTKEILIKYKDFQSSFNIEVTYKLEDIEDYEMYSSTSLNLRNGPGTEFDKINSIPVNTKVLVLEETKDGWGKIKYNDNEYFCSLKYLSKEKMFANLNNFDFNSSIITIEGNISNECLDKVIELYKKIPQNVINAMSSKGYRIMISNNSIYTQGHAGMYWPFEMNYYKYAAIYATSIEKVNMAVIHECGHFIDNYLGNKEGRSFSPVYGFRVVSSDPNWVQIYKEEVGVSGFPSWSNNCPEEYFAECVWKVLTIPSWCQKTIPRSYEYVLNCINRC